MPTTTKSDIVIKLGGSLLDLPDLAPRLLKIAHQGDHRAIILVGGGRLVDRIRTAAVPVNLSADTCHDLALHAMSSNASAVALLNSEFRFCHTVEEISRIRGDSDDIPVLHAADIISRLESGMGKLPRSWAVTSDSIAAWLAASWRCGLLLLKSVPLPESLLGSTPESSNCQRSALLTALAECGLVDNSFPHFAAELPALSWCNLRNRESVQSSIW